MDMDRQIASMKASGRAKDCCLVKDNLFVAESGEGRIVFKCRACDCRHFRMKAPLPTIGITLNGGA